MAASEVIVNVVFFLMAAAAVGGAIMVAVSKNIVRSAFYLLAVLFSAAGFYAVMRADFIAIAQVLIYVGGILVLIIFAVMLTHRITDVNISNESAPAPVALVACFGVGFALLVIVLGYDGWQRGPEPVRTKAGGVDVELSQYQADGKTGMAWGGNAFEPRVVLEAAVAPDAGIESVRFEVRKDGDEHWKDATKATAKVVDGTARAEVEDLPVDSRETPDPENEGALQWRVRLFRGGKAVGDGSRPDDAAGTDFIAYRGVTEPVARLLAGPYLFAFEAISVLLLAALIGAAFLARKEVRE